jgi:hypothetical protein
VVCFCSQSFLPWQIYKLLFFDSRSKQRSNMCACESWRGWGGAVRAGRSGGGVRTVPGAEPCVQGRVARREGTRVRLSLTIKGILAMQNLICNIWIVFAYNNNLCLGLLKWQFISYCSLTADQSGEVICAGALDSFVVCFCSQSFLPWQISCGLYLTFPADICLVDENW